MALRYPQLDTRSWLNDLGMATAAILCNW